MHQLDGFSRKKINFPEKIIFTLKKSGNPRIVAGISLRSIITVIFTEGQTDRYSARRERERPTSGKSSPIRNSLRSPDYEREVIANWIAG